MLNEEHRPHLAILLFAWLGLALLGCASPSGQDAALVHLHVDTLSSSEQIAIRDALREEGFTVKLRDNHIPFDVNTLIYSPFIGVENHLERIGFAMNAAGYMPDDLILRQARNHHYTPGHFGLYLRGEQANAPEEEAVLEDIPFNLPDAEFVSEECESRNIMEFAHDGTVAVAHIDDDTPETLQWTEANNEVTLKSGRTAYRYDKIIDIQRDTTEITFLISLRPIGEYTSLYGCEYLGRTNAVALDN